MAERISSRELRRKSRELTDSQSAIRNQEEKGFQGTARNTSADISRANYQTYPYDYYSGADCKVFYGDIWVDDIITIQWSVNQNKTPIYGYASQLFDAVAKGQILVQGTMSVAFKEVGYLNLIQSTMEAQRRDAGKLVARKIDTVRALADNRLAKFEPRLTQLGDNSSAPSFSTSFNPVGIPEVIRNEETIEQILLGKKAGQSLSREMQLQNKNRDFEDFAEILEDSIWGDSNGTPFTLSNKLKRADEFDYNSINGIITALGEDYSNVLNILLTFGDINDFRAEHTLVALNDVHFVSTGMVISPTGEPIAETYNFFARDINKSISNEIKATINPIKLDVGNDDLTLSKVEDIATIEEYLSRTPNEIMIQFEAAFDEFGWSRFSGEIIGDFSVNNSQPFVDQIISTVERLMNSLDPNIAKIVKTDKQQYIIKVVGAGVGDQDIVMVLEQGVPNARTYRVISPTRNAFGARSIITREDMFGDITSMPAPLEVVKSNITARENELKNRADKLAADKENFDSAEGEVGREDEQKRLNRAKSRLSRLSSVPEDERSSFRQKLIDRQEQRVKDRQDEFEFADRWEFLQSEGQGLQDERRALIQAKQAQKEILKNRDPNEPEDLIAIIARRRVEKAEEELRKQEELNEVERSFSKEELTIFNERKNIETEIDTRSKEIQEDLKQIDTLNKDFAETQAKYKAEEAARKQSLANAAKRIASEEKLKREEQKIKDVEAAERYKQLTEEELKAAEEFNKSVVQKMNDVRAKSYSNDIPGNTKVKIDISEYNRLMETTNRYGQSITSSALSHQARPDIHTSGRIYGLKKGELIGLDLGNINPDGSSAGFVNSPLAGKIVSKGRTSFTIIDDDGNQVTYEHVSPDYVANLTVNSKLKKGQQVSFGRGDHIQLTTQGYSAKELERKVWDSGTTKGYRNTVPTENAKYLLSSEEYEDTLGGKITKETPGGKTPQQILIDLRKNGNFDPIKEFPSNFWNALKQSGKNIKNNFK
jgi:hypothetical protein